MTKKIAIFGGGISGLTIAHELIKNGFNVDIYEYDSIIGGMARSKRDMLNVPNEHSFRMITESYYNTIDILKQIPLINNINLNTYNNLIFGFFQLKLFNYNDKSIPFLSYSDAIYLYYLYLNFNVSNNRKNKFYKKKIKPLLKQKLTKDGYDYVIKLMGVIGPMNINMASIGNFFNNLNLSQEIYTYFTKNTKSMFYTSFFNQPTSEAWFDNWENDLRNKGVKIHFNAELTKIYNSNNIITHCEVNNNPVIADYYIVSTSPYHAEKIFLNSNLYDIASPYTKLNVTHNQISFRIGFNINLRVDKFNSVFLLFDSPYGIMICQQDSLWNKNIKLDNNKTIKALWSGICTDSITNGLLYNKSLTLNNKSQLYDEILFQLFKSNNFIDYFQDINPLFSVENIIYFEIFDDWATKNSSVLKSKYPKWSDTFFNYEHKPTHHTKYNNLFIAGSHCQTSTDNWLMESAIDSGKIVSNLILEENNLPKVYYYDHKKKSFITLLLSLIDDFLFAFFGEYVSIIDTLLILMCVILLYILYNKIK